MFYQVLPSQRQSKTSEMYEVWVCLKKEDGWVLTGNCTCMAGLGSACSHVAALLFKLETAVHAGLNERTVATSELCAWKACKRSVTPAPLNSINFKKPKRGLLPSECMGRTESVGASPGHYSCNDPTTGQHALSAEHLKTLYELTPKSAFFTSVCTAEYASDNSRMDSDTDSDTENDDNCLPEPLTSMFDPTAIGISGSELVTRSECLYKAYCESHGQNSYNNLCKVTEKQSESTAWMLHRAGRITASTCHQVSHMRENIPSESTIATIMQYKQPFDNKYVRYGRQMEATAKQCFTQEFSVSHEDVHVHSTGFHVDADIPYLGASPDGFVSCACHASAVLEIKCPYTYQKGLIGWENDASFALHHDLSMKENHKYYYQIQLKMLICHRGIGYFFVYAPTERNSSLCSTVVRNDDLLNRLQVKLFNVFKTIMLPEIVSRCRDDGDNSRQVYCMCRRPSFGYMIACEAPQCDVQWYHYACVNITRAPRGKWICDSCKSRSAH